MSDYPKMFEDLNSLSTKQLNVVVCFEGYSTCFSLVPTFKKIRYGDPDLFYGDPGIVYGGYKELSTVRPILSINSSMNIAQKIEPEQGRSSVATFSLEFLDLDGFMTEFVSPGVLIDEILGGKLVKVYLGFQNSSFKEDYFCVFRGYVTMVICSPAKVILQLSDSNIKRKQQVFFTGVTQLSSLINDSTLSIPVYKTDGFISHVLGPNGLYDSTLKTYVKIEDEYIQYAAGGIGPSLITATLRGARSTLAASHPLDAEVTNVFDLTGNVIDLCLKIMLSGINGVYTSANSIYSFVHTNDPSIGDISDAISLPDGVNAVDDYGLAIGDYIYVTGSASNDGTYIISGFLDRFEYPNNIIRVNASLVLEPTTSGVFSARSQYDTLPPSIGNSLTPLDVDVARFKSYKSFFFSQNDNVFSFLITQPESAKDWIQRELLLPVGAYDITRFGKISIAITKPPIADDRTNRIDWSNLVNPQSITVQRGLNNRRYFSEVQYRFDYNDSAEYESVVSKIDSDSLAKIKVSSVLPINSFGLKTVNGAATLIDRRGSYILRRYSKAAYEISIQVNFTVGALIEVNDVVALYDEGNLKISNLENGDRNLGAQLYEVIDRSIDLKTGVVSLKLLSSLGYSILDRFATISPSSIVGIGSTTSSIKITDSYGALYPGNEKKKWEQFAGLQIVVRSKDYSVSEKTTLVQFSPSDPYLMLVSPALSFTPLPGYIIDTDEYPNTTNPLDNQAYKMFFIHQSPTAIVVSGISTTQFTVSVSDALLFTANQPVIIHNNDYSILSAEVIVDSVVGQTITLKTAISFIPAAGQKVDGIGFIDGGGPYRIL